MKVSFQFCLLFLGFIEACTPGVKTLKTSDRSKAVYVKFGEFNNVKLRPIKGFGKTTSYILSVPGLNKNSTTLTISYNQGGIEKEAYFFSNIPEASLSYSLDSTILYAKGGVQEGYYLISRQLDDKYNITLSSFGEPKNATMSPKQRCFLEKLALNISISDK